MKAIKYLPCLIVIGIALLVVATYGTAHDTSCSNPITWTAYTAYSGLLLVFCGLMGFFRSKNKSWAKTVALSLLTTIFLAVLVAIVDTALLPGGIFHCYVF